MKYIKYVLFLLVVSFVVFFIDLNFMSDIDDPESVNVDSVHQEEDVINHNTGSNNSSGSLHDNNSDSRLNNLDPRLKDELNNIINTSSEGLEEIKTDNGEMVDLEDRFKAVPVATINEKGEVVVRDYVSPPSD